MLKLCGVWDISFHNNFVSVGMLGNISMIIRTDAYRADGISVAAGIVISMIIYIAVLFIGRRICLKDDYV